MDFVKFGTPFGLFVGALSVGITATLDYWWAWLAVFAVLLGLYYLWQLCKPGASIENEDPTELATMQSSNTLNGDAKAGNRHKYVYQPDLGMRPLLPLSDDEDDDNAYPEDDGAEELSSARKRHRRIRLNGGSTSTTEV